MFIAAEFLFLFRLKLKEARKQTRTILINPTNTKAQILNVQHLLVVIVIYYFLFAKLPWPEVSEGTFRSSSQAATCPPVYHTRWRLHTVPLIAERQAGKL